MKGMPVLIKVIDVKGGAFFRFDLGQNNYQLL